jgi:BlaI family transcriptional regulator, penicillinase repressor
MKPPKAVPTDLELVVLKAIWKRGQATVREIYQDLAMERKIAYTTVLTMMGVLEHKGRLQKTAGERAYVYRPTQPKDQVVDNMVVEFVNRVFSGSAKPLLVHLLEDPNIPPEDLAEIERLLRARRKRNT